MKREGLQRGALKVSRNKLLRVAAAAADDSEAAESVVGVGVVATEKAPAAKLTNASKSTGKCRRLRCSGCHHHPVKAKGAHKLRAYDVTLNHRLVSWRVVDGGGGGVGIPNYKGASASSLLADLAGSINGSWYEDDEDTAWSVETAADGGLSDLYDLIVGPRAGRAVAAPGEADPACATDEHEGDTDEIEEQQEQDGDHGNEGEDDEAMAMGFCLVGIKIALALSDSEDDWIVVEEI